MPKIAGQNFTAEIKDGQLVITVDLEGETTPSSTGKTDVIASSRGNKQIGDVVLGLNVYRYREPKPKK